MKYLIITLLSLSLGSVRSQDLNDSIEFLYNKGEYLEVIKLFDHQEELNDISYYYVGYSYYMQSEYAKANEYYFKSLKINKGNPIVYYYMSISYQNMELKDSALYFIDKAIQLDTTVTEYVTYKGDLYYYYNQVDSSIYYFKKACNMRLSTPSQWINLADVYAEYKMWDNAEKTYQLALEKCAQGSDIYYRGLYNYGLTLYLTGKFDGAIKSFSEIHEAIPNDYTTLSKLIQSYYGKEDFKKAESYKKEMYKAKTEGKLPKNMESMFCIDQFKWNNQKVMVFERFDEPEEYLYYKHIFYVLNETEEDYDCTVQSEHSAAVSSVKKKYVMGMNKGNTHYTYWQHLFSEKFDYSKMKEAVIEILEGKSTPSSSSTYD